MALGTGHGTGLKITNTEVQVQRGSLVVPNGYGINFSATVDGTGSSNRYETLDDYEEGTWTPSLNGTSASPSGGSLTQNRCRYTKVGNIVHIMAYIAWDADFTGASGAARIQGLPFAGNSNEYGVANIGFMGAPANVLLDGHSAGAYIDGANIYFYVVPAQTAGGSGTTFSASNWFNGYAGHVQFVGTYRTDA